MVIGRVLTLAMVAAVASTALGERPAQAHSDWALPLIGGLVGGYATKSILDKRHERQEQAAPAPARAPAAAPAASAADTIEDKLNTLDQLAAQGYITKDEYNARRQALLNQL
jgi:hypothetical protein